MISFSPSKYQQEVFDEIQYGDGNILINAVAGSGKTTTIVEALKLISVKERILFCAFNNSIVDELRLRCPSHVKVTTLHSLGWSSMKRFFGDSIVLNSSKAFSYADRMFKYTVPKEFRNYNAMMLSKLVDLYRVSLADGKEDLRALADKHDIDYTDVLLDQTLILMEAMSIDTSQFDFTDMVYIPAILPEIQLPKYDYIFVDECQDLNAAQQSLIQKCRKRISRTVFVGDPSQAIYGFAGADVESFYHLSNKQNTKVLPLSICYRCPKSVIELAQEIVPQIESSPDSFEGEAREGTVCEIRNGDWVLCRNVRPLILLCVDLLSRGKKAHVKGVEIGKAIILLLKKTKEKTYKGALKKLMAMLLDLKNELKSRGVRIPEQHPRYLKLRERISIIMFLSKGNKSTSQIILQLEKIFKQDKKGIQLSTIHKAKGLENDRVFLICPELLPSKYATQPWQIEQELNLKYVAYTRAKKSFIWITDFNENIVDFRSISNERD